MAFQRVLELVAGPAEGVTPIQVAKAARISDVDVDCKVSLTRNVTSDKASFRAYNLSDETINTYLAKGNNISLTLGFEDEAISGLVFIGNIDNVITKWVSGNKVTEIDASTYAVSNSKLANAKKKVQNTYAWNYAPGVTMDTVLNDVAALMGLSVTGLAEARNVKRGGGFSFIGTLKSLLSYIDTLLLYEGYGLFTSGTKLLVFDVTKESNVVEEETPFLFYEIEKDGSKVLGTLLNFAPQEKSDGRVSIIPTSDNKAVDTKKKRMRATALADPRLLPNRRVFIKPSAKEHSGQYEIDKATFTVDNYSNGGFKVALEVLG